MLGRAWEALEFAEKSHSPVMAKGLLEGIYIPRSKMAFIDIPYSRLRSLSLVPDRPDGFCILPVNIHGSELRAKIDKMNPVPMEQILWDLGL